MADDQPMWGNNMAIAPTPGAAIVALLEDRVLLKLDWSKENKAKPIQKTIAFAKSKEHSPLLEKIEALTTRIDSQFKEIKGDMKEMRDGCNKYEGHHPSSDCDDKPMGRPEEEKANYAFKGYRGNCYGQNYGNWRYLNPNAKPAIFLDDSEDEADEVAKKAEPLPKKPTHADPLPLKAYKQKIPYPQRLHKEKMEARYAKFLEMIKEVRINANSMPPGSQDPTTPYFEPERFIHQTLRKKKKRNPFIPIKDRVPKAKYRPFKNLFEAEVVYNLFLDLPFPMADDQPMWGNNRAVAPTPGAAIVAVDLGDNFTVKRHHHSMIKDR
nr:reverse transcriptase domain-containing protein [Tanacetum cinerariifolium]